jgi:hypothetical protein
LSFDNVGRIPIAFLKSISYVCLRPGINNPETTLIKKQSPITLNPDVKMNTYLSNLFHYFENVLHPASGWSSNKNEKRKRRSGKGNAYQASPECFNSRAATVKKQEKARMNPAP